jgi:hypothetical protein
MEQHHQRMACVLSIVSMVLALIPASRSVKQHHLLGIVSTAAAQISAVGSVKRRCFLDLSYAEWVFVRGAALFSAENNSIACRRRSPRIR